MRNEKLVQSLVHTHGTKESGANSVVRPLNQIFLRDADLPDEKRCANEAARRVMVDRAFEALHSAGFKDVAIFDDACGDDNLWLVCVLDQDVR